jgi:hypothetical protein
VIGARSKKGVYKCKSEIVLVQRKEKKRRMVWRETKKKRVGVGCLNTATILLPR